MSAVSQISSGWQAGFLQVLHTIETHAKIQFRKLRPERREEAIQETLAAACMNYQIAVTQGKQDVIRPGPLADFAVRHVRTGRHVGGKQDAAKDVMSPVAHQRHGVQLQSYHAHRSGDGTDGWRQVAIEDRKASIPDLAAFRIDFAQWLKSLTRRDRRIIAAFVSGERTMTVADQFGISEARVSQLRRKYEQEWQVFQGEGAIASAA
jgi:hypothetical protein